MNKNEKMYDAITNIRDDIIEKAGEYKFSLSVFRLMEARAMEGKRVWVGRS